MQKHPRFRTLDVRRVREKAKVVPRLVEKAPASLVQKELEFLGSTTVVVYHVEHLHCQFVGRINDIIAAGE